MLYMNNMTLLVQAQADKRMMDNIREWAASTGEHRARCRRLAMRELREARLKRWADDAEFMAYCAAKRRAAA